MYKIPATVFIPYGFVNRKRAKIIKAENSDKEIELMGQIDLSNQAVVDVRYITPQILTYDSTSKIQQTYYKANHISYESNTTSIQFAVFSEIFYDKGWNAYIDGKLTSHVRANYVLRGLEIPSGKHKIDFKFEPSTLLLLFVGYKEYKKII